MNDSPNNENPVTVVPDGIQVIAKVVHGNN